ncbi:class I adenylate-forming enzyme family protein [Microvirga vignae]|nr:AMP-binding protein [Microvirga vignae]
MSYAELQDRTDRLARSFLVGGATPPQRIAFLGDNGHVPYEIMITAAKLGLTYVPIDFRLTDHEVLSILQDCKPHIFVVGPAHLALVERIRDRAGSIQRWIALSQAPVPGYELYEDLIVRGEGGGLAYADDDGLFCILYTSGTTGRAKGVKISHRATLHNGLALAKAYAVDEHTRFLMSLPYSATGVVNHSSGPTLMMGGTVVFDEVRNFEAARFFSVIERNRVSHCQLVPTMMFRLLDSPDRTRFDLSSLRTVGYGSAPIPAHRVQQLTEAFGSVFVQAYGMTETCSLATTLNWQDHDVVGTPRQHILASCGRAVAEVEIRIIGDDGREVETGSVGEVAIRAPWNTSGYWANDQQTRELLRNGWLYTGDLGRMDEEEYLYIVDRKKDTVITGGSKVFSPEVEAAIASHPDVAEVAVIGLPDEQWGEHVHAVIVLRGGAVLTNEDIVAHAARSLSRYKLPKSVEFVTEIPKTSTGKYAKNVLRRLAVERPSVPGGLS